MLRESPSSRRAWIEIEGSHRIDHRRTVALLAEGVDRNSRSPMLERLAQVALLAEGVDRNLWSCGILHLHNWSPSSRRAWIEITNTAAKTLLY